MQLEKIDRERQIIRMFRRGETSAMDVLYAEYADYLNAVCSRYISDGNTVKDVLQESFIKIFENVGSFEYRGKGSLKAWISRRNMPNTVESELLYGKERKKNI